MAPPASKEADEAVEMLLNGTALTAKQAMQYTGKFNEKDMSDDNQAEQYSEACETGLREEVGSQPTAAFLRRAHEANEASQATSVCICTSSCCCQ
jgi:hypothetical protein